MKTLHLGVMVPSVNTITEREWHTLAPPGVHVHVERIPVTQADVSDDQSTTVLLDQVRAGVDDSVDRLATCRPDAIVMGMSAPVFYGGAAGSRRFIDSLRDRTSVRVIAAAHAMVDALQLMEISSIAVLSPYQRVNDEQVERFFAESGFALTRLTSVRSTTTRGIAETPERQVLDTFRELAKTGAEAIVQVGANLGVTPVIDQAERWLGIPVLSLNATGLWSAMRACGRDDQLLGMGRLWREW